MLDHRVNLLNFIGFVWNQLESTLDVMFQRLGMYKKQHGSTLVPKMYKEDLKLKRWVKAQREKYNHNELSADQIKRLESIGFAWDVHEE